MDKVSIVLKDIKIGYSKFSEPTSMTPADTPKYKGSLLIYKGDENFMKVDTALKAITKNLDAALAQKFYDQKVKEVKEKYRTNENERAFWVSSSYRPRVSIITTGEVETLADDIEDKDIPAKFLVTGGSTVNIEVLFRYFEPTKDRPSPQLAAWPQAILLKKQESVRSAEWLAAMEEAQEEASSA